ncbi:MAG: PilC/PilY family type IV pilus protein [Luteimonas sp.]|nr:PilC/PilY family type IV pilus protein [Luteimonas sp.]
MNFYAITLGARGVSFDPDANPKQDPFVTPIAWPTTRPANNSAATVDDLWHATVNTRGDFINANTPEEITAAMRRILASVSSGASPSGSIAITGARIGAGSLQVTPSYDVRNEGTDWSSELTAHRVQLNATTRIPETVLAWRASERFPTHGSRDVFFSRGTGNAQRFNATNVTIADMCTAYACTATQVSALGATATLGNAVNYLLGDVTQEKRNGGPFRDRSTRLGDIVNSTPVVSSPTDDYGYASLGGTLGSTYRTYLTTTKATRRYMVYVGANDGMLHAFDGGLTKAMVEAGQAPDLNGGREEFAYIPATSLGKMGNLLFPYDATNQNDQKFQHRYYVDGPLTVSDAHYGTGWSTVLVGSAGAGGRSVFALDVSNPASFGASNRLWEISNLNTSLLQPIRDDIGHVLGAPVIVPVKQRNSDTVVWKAIFGNGYESAANGGRGRAVLFMVDIGTGNPVVRRIVAEESSPGLSSTSRNGLGNIVVVDRWGGDDLNSPQRDGFADTVYAADQQGALWKFDIRDAAFAGVPGSGAAVATITTPLFRTQEHTDGGGRYRQPILGGLTATSGPNGGVMIYFGTGSFSFQNDPTDTVVQSLYAINDTERVPTTATVALNTLVRYTVTAIAGVADRTLTRQTNPLNSRGWYVDLPARERFVGNPEIATGVVFMPTYSPNPSASGCSTSGFNSLFGLNARTGAPALSSVRYGSPGGTSPASGTASIGLNTGGTAPVKDVGVMAIPRQPPPPLTGGAPGSPPPAPPAPPEQGCWMMVSVAGAQAMYLPYPCGRQSWRQIQ